MPMIGDAVHFRDSRKICMRAFVVGTCQMNLQTGETPDGKPIYKSVPGLEVEVIDNGGRYTRTLLHSKDAHPRSDSYHLEGEC
jgi:hypothetical protein